MKTEREWLHHLMGMMDLRDRTLKVYEDYYEGRQGNVLASSDFLNAFGEQLRGYADNWCKLIVDAAVERLSPVGFRFPALMGDAADVAAADEDANRMWQRNHLDARSHIAHTEASLHGVSYTLTWPSERGARITVEHPRQAIVEHDPADTTLRLAGLKRWLAADGKVHATLYLPDAVFRFETYGQVVSGVPLSEQQWQPRVTPDSPAEGDNPMGLVPLVPLVNRPRSMNPYGTSDIAEVIPNQNAINKLIQDMLVASEYGAFVQRWATGVDVPKDPQTGQPLEGWQASAKRMLTSTNPEARFGGIDATDLKNFVSAIDLLVQHVASQTRTPPHYLNASADRLSGESIKSAETGLVAKVRQKQINFGEGWEETIRLGFIAEGDLARGTATDVETVWRDPESRTDSELVDSVGKKRQMLHVPLRQAWEDVGYTPQQIGRMESQLAAESLQFRGLDVDGLFDADTV